MYVYKTGLTGNGNCDETNGKRVERDTKPLCICIMHSFKDRHVTISILVIVQKNDTYLWIFCVFLMILDTQQFSSIV